MSSDVSSGRETVILKDKKSGGIRYLRKKRKTDVPIGRIPLLIIFASLFLTGFSIGQLYEIPFYISKGEYAIGVYSGDSPFSLAPHPEISNPVLTFRDVSDIPADFVADPFMVRENGVWYMFFEVLNRETEQGDIGLASSVDGKEWKYDRIVLDEPFHLSYPYVFEWEGEYYMVPESKSAFAVTLYKAEKFPREWRPVKTLIKGNFSDPSVFRHNDYWWIFVSETNDILRLFFSDSLQGTWHEHPGSPLVVRDARYARPGGRVIALGDTLLRLTQDCKSEYGLEVNGFLIVELTPEKYSEVSWEGNPVLQGSGKGWNAKRMHHLDAHRIADNLWIAAVDGWRRSVRIGWKGSKQ